MWSALQVVARGAASRPTAGDRRHTPLRERQCEVRRSVLQNVDERLGGVVLELAVCVALRLLLGRRPAVVHEDVVMAARSRWLRRIFCADATVILHITAAAGLGSGRQPFGLCVLVVGPLPQIPVQSLAPKYEAVVECAGEAVDGFAQLEHVEPVAGDGLYAQQRARDVARDRCGAVAVAGVVRGQAHRCREIVGVRQHRVHGDRERLFSDPALAERADRVRARPSTFGEGTGLAKRIVDLAVNRVDRRMNGKLKRRSVLEVSDDARQRSGRRVTGRVTVRPACRHVANEEWLDAPSGDEPTGRRSHHASTALAVIGGRFIVVLEHRALLEGADARLPRRSG